MGRREHARGAALLLDRAQERPHALRPRRLDGGEGVLGARHQRDRLAALPLGRSRGGGAAPPRAAAAPQLEAELEAANGELNESSRACCRCRRSGSSRLARRTCRSGATRSRSAHAAAHAPSRRAPPPPAARLPASRCQIARHGAAIEAARLPPPSPPPPPPPPVERRQRSTASTRLTASRSQSIATRSATGRRRRRRGSTRATPYRQAGWSARTWARSAG